MKKPIVVTPAGFNAFAFADIKDSPELRANTDDETEIEKLIEAAQEKYEEHTGNILRSSTLKLELDSFPEDNGFVELPSPISSIVHVKYYDAAGSLQTLASSKYKLDQFDRKTLAKLFPAYGETWPATYDQINSVEIQFVAGFADADAIPEIIKRGMIAFIQEILDGTDRTQRYSSLWRSYRRISFS